MKIEINLLPGARDKSLSAYAAEFFGTREEEAKEFLEKLKAEADFFLELQEGLAEIHEYLKTQGVTPVLQDSAVMVSGNQIVLDMIIRSQESHKFRATAAWTDDGVEYSLVEHNEDSVLLFVEKEKEAFKRRLAKEIIDLANEGEVLDVARKKYGINVLEP